MRDYKYLKEISLFFHTLNRAIELSHSDLSNLCILRLLHYHHTRGGWKVKCKVLMDEFFLVRVLTNSWDFKGMKSSPRVSLVIVSE